MWPASTILDSVGLEHHHRYSTSCWTEQLGTRIVPVYLSIAPSSHPPLQRALSGSGADPGKAPEAGSGCMAREFITYSACGPGLTWRPSLHLGLLTGTEPPSACVLFAPVRMDGRCIALLNKQTCWKSPQALFCVSTGISQWIKQSSCPHRASMLGEETAKNCIL